jgi:hypothetical protein
VKGANVVYVEFLLEAVSRIQIVEWASRILVSIDPIANSSEIISLAELKGIDSDKWKIQPENLLKQVVQRHYADFNVPSAETEIYARACLREKCVRFLVGKIHKSELFSVVENIHRLFKNPPWLCKLWVLACKSSTNIEGEEFEQCLKNEVKLRLTEL